MKLGEAEENHVRKVKVQTLGCIRVAPSESHLSAALSVAPLGCTTYLEGSGRCSVC